MHNSKTLQIIKTYDLIVEASKEMGVHFSSIGKACKENRLAGGYRWTYITKYNRSTGRKGKLVECFNLLFKDSVRKFNSVVDAAATAKTFNLSSTIIINVCKGKQKTAGGFGWRYSQ
ncbi:MAG: hypothetical protein H8D97_01560 [Proteobacteria bacterium]|nr:hypothetical protein [Pseudomonadota bacterium]